MAKAKDEIVPNTDTPDPTFIKADEFYGAITELEARIERLERDSKKLKSASPSLDWR